MTKCVIIPFPVTQIRNSVSGSPPEQEGERAAVPDVLGEFPSAEMRISGKWSRTSLLQHLKEACVREGYTVEMNCGSMSESCNHQLVPDHLLVADDHALFADALTSLMKSSWPLCTVTHVSDAGVVAEELACGNRFDAVLLDLRMPGMEAPDSIKRIVEAADGCPVILMSGLATGPEIAAALRAGIAGFIPKHRSGTELLNGVIDIINNRFDGGGEQDGPQVREDEVLARLSRRELETALHMARGLSNKEIALCLEISPETVKVYTKSIMTKFSVRNRTEFAVEAMRRGLV